MIEEKWIIAIEGIDTHFEYLEWFTDYDKAAASYADLKKEHPDERGRNAYLLKVLRTTERKRGAPRNRGGPRGGG